MNREIEARQCGRFFTRGKNILLASSIEILGARLEEACLKKGEIFFIRSPRYLVKRREFFRPLKNCSFEVNYEVMSRV
jgi:hypothetical protein